MNYTLITEALFSLKAQLSEFASLRAKNRLEFEGARLVSLAIRAETMLNDNQRTQAQRITVERNAFDPFVLRAYFTAATTPPRL